jgi:hypothetical protein
MAKGDYDKEVLNEGGYTVELSNRGELKKRNPNCYNIQKELICCSAEGCKKQTRSIYGRCGAHMQLRNCPLHDRDWLGRTVPPGKSSEEVKTFALPHREISKMLVEWVTRDEVKGKKMDAFVDDIIKTFHGKIPDATTLQKIYEGTKIEDAVGPDDLVEMTKKLVDKHFPKKEYEKVLLKGGTFRGITLEEIPLRVVLINQVLAFTCEESNRGDSWAARRLGLKPKYANMFMPLALYLLFRKGATVNEANMAVKSS